MKHSKTLSEEMDSILISSILDWERVRDNTIAYICKSCCDIFDSSKIKKDKKTDSFEKIAKKCVADPEQEGNRLVEYLKNNNNIIEFYDVYP